MDITREQKMLKRLKRHNLSRTEITDKSIWDLQIKMGWHGSGEEFDPIIIDSLSGLKPNVWIHKSSKHYIIHDVIISKLVCTSTQNIVLENSKINELEVEGCYNVTILIVVVLWIKRRKRKKFRSGVKTPEHNLHHITHHLTS